MKVFVLFKIITTNIFSLDISELYGSDKFGPRLNPQLQMRHTVAVNEGESAFFYCSFDGHPKPVIEWYHTDIKILTSSPLSSSSSLNYYTKSSSSTQFSNHFSNQNIFSWSSSSPSSANSAFDSASTSSSTSYVYGRNFLVIEKVSTEDTGIITCVANNSNSIVRHEMLLFVKSKFVKKFKTFFYFILNTFMSLFCYFIFF